MRSAMLLSTAALLLAAITTARAQPSSPRLALYAERASPQDLAIQIGSAAAPQQFLRYDDLARLPQVAFTVSDDANFPHPTRLSGVPLERLLHAIDSATTPQIIAALCDDGYEAHYTAEYIAAHHPILVLRIDGHDPAQWPATADGGSYGPWLISHVGFTPAFHILAHAEEPQIPYGVIALHFLDQESALRPLRPQPTPAFDTPPMQGYRIALENCLRCHQAGSIGGTKAKIPWQLLSAIASADPALFSHVVTNPVAVNPRATMPANPAYDAPTLAALTAYFQAVARQSQETP